MEVLEGRLTQVELEIDSEVEEMGEAEESEVIGMEELGTMGGTQLSAMEVDEEEEDEVVVVEEVKQGEMRKQAPLSLLKMSRKSVCTAMAMQLSVGSQGPESLVQGSQVGSGQVVQGGHVGGVLNTECSASWSAGWAGAKTAEQNTTGVRLCHPRSQVKVEVEHLDRRR